MAQTQSPPWSVDVALATSRAVPLDISVPSLAQSLVEFGPFDRVWVWSRAGSGPGRLLTCHPRASTRPTTLTPAHALLTVTQPEVIGDAHDGFDECANAAGVAAGAFLLIPVPGYAVLQLHAVRAVSDHDAETVALLARRLVDRALADGPEASLDGKVPLPADLFEDIVEHLPTMVFIKDAKDLRFVLVNRLFESLTGIPREELIGSTDHDFFPADEADFFTANDRQVLNTGLLQDILEEPIQTKQGKRWLHTKKMPLLDEDGHPAYLLGISEDITARRNAEEQLESLRADLETRVRLRTSELETAYRELESFVHAISHDLRGPVRVIHSFAEILMLEQSDALGAEGRPLVDSILTACGRLETLFEGILNMARISSAPMNLERVPLSEVAGRIAAEFCSVHQHHVSVFIEPDMDAEADPSMVEVLLSNLLNNALKFSATTTGPRVEVVRMKDADGPPTWCVRDNGVGFEMAYAERLFRPFQRLHDPQEFPGTGIGLATSARVISRHGGRIWAESAPGQGARFYFTLAAESPA